MPVEILSMDFIASPPHGTDGIVIMCRLSDTSIRALLIYMLETMQYKKLAVAS